MTHSELKKAANRIRINSLFAIYKAGSGHPGGALSVADILSWLVLAKLKWNPENIQNEDRDRLILSKGHSAPALYAAAVEAGILEFEDLTNFRKIGNPLQGHTHRGTLPWVEASTGSLGQGFSFGIGEVVGFRHQHKQNRVYVILGDGELQEGEIWEGAMFAGHYQLSNLCAIVDYNKMQSDDLNSNIITLEPLAEKWRAFNWNVIEINGHDFTEIRSAIHQFEGFTGKPTVIIANTIKGCGVSYMEGSPAWHGSVELSDDDFFTAMKNIGVSEEEKTKYAG